MTININQIITTPESKTLEFKRDMSSHKPLLKTLVAFANTAGGKLIIGITDDRTVLGVENPLDEEERLTNMIGDSISPRLIPNIEMTTVEGKTLLMIKVFLSNTRPHHLNSEGAKQGVYVRLGSSNRQADPLLIAEMQRGAAGISFDCLPLVDLS
ncbi:MAG: putative DNA binding domain-containing protein, partial [Desulfuromusa sp.]|nr:putative DNA binding domain-containing protein [Desulfuromusa sp.]